MQLDIEIKKHPHYPETHSVVIVTTPRGVYACAWAGTPTAEEALQAWKNDRRCFRPYNTSTGYFTK